MFFCIRRDGADDSLQNIYTLLPQSQTMYTRFQTAAQTGFALDYTQVFVDLWFTIQNLSYSTPGAMLSGLHLESKKNISSNQ